MENGISVEKCILKLQLIRRGISVELYDAQIMILYENTMSIILHVCLFYNGILINLSSPPKCKEWCIILTYLLSVDLSTYIPSLCLCACLPVCLSVCLSVFNKSPYIYMCVPG